MEAFTRRNMLTCQIESEIDVDAIIHRAVAALPSIAGWCTPEKAEKLARYAVEAKPAVALEIGIFGGSSLAPLAMAMKAVGGIVYGIDPWTVEACLEEMNEPVSIAWWARLDIIEIQRGCFDMLRRLNIADSCWLIQAKAEDVAAKFASEIGLLHIDGNHSEVTSYKDATMWLPKVAVGGAIFCDDFSWVENGVRTTEKAVSYLLSNGCEEIDVVGDCLILRKTA